ncbi:MAG: lamin tail domain-containing protein [Verrucomicrobiales bacterium]|nr:lamin tail domain-containing protein [Verrucomicrobiales bacterium]
MAREFRTGDNVETVVPLGALWRWFTDAIGLGSSAIVEGHPQWSTGNWKHAEFVDEAWGIGNAQFGYGEGDESTLLPFGGDAANKWITAYFRHAVEIRGTHPVLRSYLHIRRDDGVIVYVNGREIARLSMTAAEAFGQTLASSPSDDGQDLHEVEVPLSALRQGLNVVAVELHQSSRGTSDASFDLEWTLIRGGAEAGEAPVLDRNTIVKARSRQGSEWSGLVSTFYQVSESPLPQGSVAVVEIQYHPLGDDSGEYLVLRNGSEQAVNLRGARFIDGIQFAFRGDLDVPLAPGESLILVRDWVRFRERYGPDIPIFGVYSGALNNAGERLVLVDARGDEVTAFEYRTTTPWPSEPDGSGARLLLVEPGLGLDSARAWRASLDTNGVPGISDATAFVGDSEADFDGDGWNGFLEYAFGTSDDDPTSIPGPWETGFREPGWFVVQFPVQGRADDARIDVDASEDLKSWQPALWLGARRLDGSRTEAAWGIPIRPGDASFLRIRVRRR